MRSAGDALPTPHDINAACESLEALKSQLRRIETVGGGEPSQGLLTAAADDCADAVVVCTPRAEIRMVNGVLARLTGYSTRDLQRLTYWDLTHGSAQGDFDVLWKEFLRAGRQRGVHTLRHQDGSPLALAYCAETKVFGELNVTVLRKPVL